MKTMSAVLIAVSVSALALSGCHVTESKDGKKSNVAVNTPFGSMNVKTSENGDSTSTGLSVYPGATPVQEGDKKHDNADVSFNFGSFHLGVKAASYQTNDSVDKVIAFYKNDMAKYGDVIQCRGDQVIGSPTHTSQGLTCDEKNKNDIHTDDGDHKHELELRAGSKRLQHIVGVEQKNGATRIGLVYLSLPGGMDSDGKNAE